MVKTAGMICAVVMPFFNIPLMIRVIRRKSSADISLVWVVGVWLCILGMFPASLLSIDPILVIFSIVNTTFFTGVVIVCLFYHPSIRRRWAPGGRPEHR